jgi:hypothetical protein
MRLVLSSLVAGLLATVPTFADQQTWTGQISDSKCGATHMTGKHGKNMSDRDCAHACAEKGAQYVLVADGKVYKLTNHDADLKAHAGHTVKLTGEMNGETIRVATIEMVKSSK